MEHQSPTLHMILPYLVCLMPRISRPGIDQSKLIVPALCSRKRSSSRLRTPMYKKIIMKMTLVK